MAQNEITLILPGAFTLTDKQRAALKNAISVQLASVQLAALNDDPPPLPEINDPTRAAKRRVAKKPAVEAVKKKR